MSPISTALTKIAIIIHIANTIFVHLHILSIISKIISPNRFSVWQICVIFVAEKQKAFGSHMLPRALFALSLH